jgi:hypothetical protein
VGYPFDLNLSSNLTGGGVESIPALTDPITAGGRKDWAMSDTAVSKVSLDGNRLDSLVLLDRYSFMERLSAAKNALVVVSISLPRLLTLDLSCNRRMTLLPDLTGCTSLTDVNLSDCTIDAADLSPVLLSTVTTLDLSNNALSWPAAALRKNVRLLQAPAGGQAPTGGKPAAAPTLAKFMVEGNPFTAALSNYRSHLASAVVESVDGVPFTAEERLSAKKLYPTTCRPDLPVAAPKVAAAQAKAAARRRSSVHPPASAAASAARRGSIKPAVVAAAAADGEEPDADVKIAMRSRRRSSFAGLLPSA